MLVEFSNYASEEERINDEKVMCFREKKILFILSGLGKSVDMSTI